MSKKRSKDCSNIYIYIYRDRERESHGIVILKSVRLHQLGRKWGLFHKRSQRGGKGYPPNEALRSQLTRKVRAERRLRSTDKDIRPARPG